jgi:hypothetical protein
VKVETPKVSSTSGGPDETKENTMAEGWLVTEVQFIDANTSEPIDLENGWNYEVVRTYVSTYPAGSVRVTYAVTE